MDYIKNVIDRALQRAKENMKPKNKHYNRVRKRQKLYNKRLKLGRARK